MNDFLFYSLLLLLFVRIIGFGVAIDLFLIKKRTKYKALIIGWLLWIISTVFPSIFTNIEDSVISRGMFVLNSIIILLGMIFIIIWAISYFRKLSPKLLLSLIAMIILIPILLFFLGGYELALNFTSLSFTGLYLIMLIISWIERHNLKPLIGNSIKWYYGTIAFGFFYIVNGLLLALEGYSFGLYQVDIPIIIIRHYFFVIGFTFLLAILSVSLEQSVSELQKFRLRDIYSHEVGNIMQIILNNLEAIQNLEEKDSTSMELIKEKCVKAGELIKEIREL